MVIINIKDKKKVILINSLLIAALFALISLNKEILRPAFSNVTIVNILTACFPNFIATYLISLVSVNAVLIRKPKYGRLIAYTSSLVIFAVLAFEELNPMWGASSYYDPYDILASALGSSLAILTYEFIIRRRQYK